MVNTEIRLIIFFAAKDDILNSQQKQDLELTVAQVIPERPSAFPYFLQFKSEFGDKDFIT